jgi:hypothetical protein
MNESEGTVGKEIGGCIDVTCVFCGEGQSGVREAMGGDVWDGGGEDGRFSGSKGTGRRRMVIGMIWAEKRGGDGF